MGWIKRLFCKHEYEFLRNIYGDEINYCGGYRSIWRCKKCGALEYRENLHVFPMMQKLDKYYDEYYKNKYQKWQNLRRDTLDKITDGMIKAAKRGECWYDTIIVCEEEFDDKYYFEKWLEENKLKVEIELYDQKEKTDKINKYKFHIRWKYHY